MLLFISIDCKCLVVKSWRQLRQRICRQPYFTQVCYQALLFSYMHSLFWCLILTIHVAKWKCNVHNVINNINNNCPPTFKLKLQLTKNMQFYLRGLIATCELYGARYNRLKHALQSYFNAPFCSYSTYNLKRKDRKWFL